MRLGAVDLLSRLVIFLSSASFAEGPRMLSLGLEESPAAMLIFLNDSGIGLKPPIPAVLLRYVSADNSSFARRSLQRLCSPAITSSFAQLVGACAPAFQRPLAPHWSLGLAN